LAQRWQADPQRREAVEDRLQLLRRLEAKYGRPIDDLIAYHATLDAKEAELQRQEDDLAAVEIELQTAFEALRQAGEQLSQRRKQVARRFAGVVQRELADLGMAEARLEIVLEPQTLGSDPATAEVPAAGLDHLEMTLAANRGEPALPLRKVA